MTSATSAPPLVGRRYPPVAGARRAPLPDVECVAYYRHVRQRAGEDCRQIGWGVNRRLPADGVRSWVEALYSDLLASRVADYSSAQDSADRALVADLAGLYLDVDDLQPDEVVLFNGSTETISILMAHAGLRGLSAVFPLPLYCSFEQSAARHGVPAQAYYGADAARVDVGHPGPGGTVLVDIAPNGVCGGWFDADTVEEDLPGPVTRVVDHVFAVPAFDGVAAVRDEVRRRVRGLVGTSVMMSPSKDLSLPGLRCGLLVTRDLDLLSYAQADRFERGYSVGLHVPRVVAMHLALLLAASEPDGRLDAWLESRFAEAELPWGGSGVLDDFRARANAHGQEFAASLATADASGLLRRVAGMPEPVAGYSALRRVVGMDDGDQLTTWAIDAAARGLKVNPWYLYGADDAVWQALYADGPGIRVNISVPADELARDLDVLGVLTRSGGHDD